MTTTAATTTTATTTEPGHRLDEGVVAAFGEQIGAWYTGAFTTFMIDLGNRTGLFAAAAEGPATSAGLAARAALDERYVREWLGAVTTVGIFRYEPATGTYTLPVEHAVCLAGDDERNLAPMSRIGTHLAPFVGAVAQAFRHGGGVPYAEYRPEFTDVMDALSRPLFDGLLVDAIVPLVDGLVDRLDGGTRAADIGCGTGHSTNVLADAFPTSTFVGYDLADDAVSRARAEAADRHLSNVAFEVADVAALSADVPFGVVFAFDAVHDQADPAAVLARVFDALEPGGTFVMLDVRASSHLERNLDNPFAPWLYAVSTLHCTPVSLASGGAGLGTVWGEELALRMLADAGFAAVEVHEVPGDPLDSLYVARKPA